MALFRISQKLTNARLHAQPTEVRVTLSFRKRQTKAIYDNGKGLT
jgi:signal transduction histidine kinase